MRNAQQVVSGHIQARSNDQTQIAYGASAITARGEI